MEENKLWRAQWIWLSEGDGAAGEDSGGLKHEAGYFRRAFTVPEGADCRLTIDVSADSRYRLFLNGVSVSVGPCKGDRWTHHYETVDLSDKLVAGDNVLAARVIHFPYAVNRRNVSSGPAGIHRSDRGGFLLQGALTDREGSEIETLNSDERWKALRDRSLDYQKERFTLFVGGPETVDGALVPHGWEASAFDDGAWPLAAIVSGTHDPNWGALSPWQLTKRPIPPLYETGKAFARIHRSGSSEAGKTTAGDSLAGGIAAAGGANGAALAADAGDGTRSNAPTTGFIGPAPIEDLIGITVPAGETRWFELDAGTLSTGYIRLDLAEGQGARIGILCSECYEYPPEPGGRRNKGVRDEWKEGKALYGPEDVYICAGAGTASKPESYEPFWFRAFRFVRLEISAGAVPVTLLGFGYRDTGYPLEATASFECSDDSLMPLWGISLNTLARCMHETYEDTPYYEQMQYTMDTRLQMLFTYYVSGDDRLARKAMYDFHSSLLPSGMLQARYPSVIPQVITGFSLFWIMMVYDHYLFYGDKTLVARYRPTIDAVLEWFDRRIEEDGLVGLLPEAYWQMIDWVEEWKDLHGAPPASRVGALAVVNLMYADALFKAADLNALTGRGCVAEEYRERARKINAAVVAGCYTEERGLFRDGPQVEQYSQHTQIWAVLSGAVQGGEASALMERMLDEPSLPAASIAYAPFLFRALSASGLYDRSFKLWDIWREQVGLHLTSWVEDPVSQRSDCHGWGASPLYEFPAEILGVTPLEPGFAVIGVAPQPGPLQWAQGTVPTQAGTVRVAWRKEEDGGFRLRVDGPKGVPVRVTMPDGTVSRLDEADHAVLNCTLR